jgi:hypothetical protein
LIRDTAEAFNVDKTQAGRLLRQHAWNLENVARHVAAAGAAVEHAAVEHPANAVVVAAAVVAIAVGAVAVGESAAAAAIRVGVAAVLLRAALPTPEDNNATADAALPATEAGPARARSHTCLICFEDTLSADDMLSMECGHAFCRACWRGVIETMLGPGLPDVALRTTCPREDCPLTLTEDLIQQAAPDLLPQFDLRQTESFVRAKRETLRFCPGPECGWVAVKPPQQFFEDEGCHHCCSNCNAHFCFRCGAAPHQGGCVVDGESLFVLVDGEPSLFLRRLPSGMKQCPKCAVVIEKTFGCNRMVCNCGHAFCWLCLGAPHPHACGSQVRRDDTNNLPHVNLTYLRDTLREGNDVADGSDVLQ